MSEDRTKEHMAQADGEERGDGTTSIQPSGAGGAGAGGVRAETESNKAGHTITFSITLPKSLVLNAPHAWNVLSLVIALATLGSMWMFSIIILGFETVFKMSATFTLCFTALLYLLFKFTRFRKVLTNIYNICSDTNPSATTQKQSHG